ncbi:uncharacterized protein A4U43_C08F16270 [Asparagus officinalis]|nr:uncharacterized protein A4U43_C08F16270 [Asparagus officinalis]
MASILDSFNPPGYSVLCRMLERVPVLHLLPDRSIWLNLAHSDSIWLNLAQSGLVWFSPGLGRPNPSPSSLDFSSLEHRLGLVQSGLVWFSQIWFKAIKELNTLLERSHLTQYTGVVAIYGRRGEYYSISDDVSPIPVTPQFVLGTSTEVVQAVKEGGHRALRQLITDAPLVKDASSIQPLRKSDFLFGDSVEDPDAVFIEAEQWLHKTGSGFIYLPKIPRHRSLTELRRVSWLEQKSHHRIASRSTGAGRTTT